MSRMMLLGALRAPIKEDSFFDVIQLKARAKEAADVIEEQDKEIESHVSALRAILDNHDKLTATDCADIARGVLGGTEE